MRDLVFLLDVDNTLLDNDKLKSDLDTSIQAILGPQVTTEFWAIYETVRRDEEYVDIPATLRSFAETHPDQSIDKLNDAVMGVRFADYVYPGAFAAVEHLSTIGTPVILSDGDPVFQKLKIEQSGLARAVDGRVLLTVHKQDEMDTVFTNFPATDYALIDDKTSILADVGRRYLHAVTTVLVCQGKYARLPVSPAPDLVLPHIGDVATIPREEFLEVGHRPEHPVD